jgi:predicted Zn-dependent protease
MRIFPVWPIVAAMAMTLFPSAAPAQTSIDACYPPAAIRALSPERHAGVNLSESDRTVKIAQIREALAQSPDDLFLNRWIVELQHKPQTGALAAEFQEKLATHPEDPRYIYLHARALVGNDTPSAIHSLQELISQEPKLPWTYLALTEIYSSAAFRDAAKVAENLREYHQACPANLESKSYVEQVLPEVNLGQTWLVDQAASIRLRRQNTPYLEQVWVNEALDKVNHPPQ